MKEVALSEKDEQLQQLHTKLHQLSTESEKERKQLQTVLAKMDKHLSTTTEELNQERLDDELKNIIVHDGICNPSTPPTPKPPQILTSAILVRFV